jgi:hypothetical protein
MSLRRKARLFAGALALTTLPIAAQACEPIIPLTQLIGGSQ